MKGAGSAALVAVLAPNVLSTEAKAKESNISVGDLTPVWKEYLNSKRFPISAEEFMGDSGIEETKYLLKDLISEKIPPEDLGREGGKREKEMYFYKEPGESFQYIPEDGALEWRQFCFVGDPKNDFYIDYVLSERVSFDSNASERFPVIHIYDSASEFKIVVDARTGEVIEFEFRKQNDAGIQETLGLKENDIDDAGFSSKETTSGLVHYSEGLKDPLNANRYVLQRIKIEKLKDPKVQQLVNGLLQYPFPKV